MDALIVDQLSWAMFIAWILLFSTGKVESATLMNSVRSSGIPSVLQSSASEKTVADIRSTALGRLEELRGEDRNLQRLNVTSSTEAAPPP